MTFKNLMVLSCVAHSALLGWGKDRTSYSIETLVTRVQHESFAAQEKAESLIRSYHNIKIAVGRLTPALNFGTIVSGIEQNYYGLAASLFGFLVPANWYKWKESKAFFQAERYSYASLVANEINALISNYYRVHSLVMLKAMYEDYLGEYQKILDIAQLRFQEAEESITKVQEVSNAVLKMQGDVVLIDEELRKVQYELAKSVNLPAETWDDFRLAIMPLPDLNAQTALAARPLIERAKAMSYELTQFDFLMQGAKKSVRSRAFDFLNPSGELDASFGFGYKSYLEVGRSNYRDLRIKRAAQETNLVFAVNEAVNNYNANINLYRTTWQGLNNTKELKQALLLELEAGEDLDLDKFVDLLDDLLGFHSKLLQTQHKFLIAKHQIDRLVHAKPYFEGLLKLAPEKPKGVFYRMLQGARRPQRTQ